MLEPVKDKNNKYTHTHVWGGLTLGAMKSVESTLYIHIPSNPMLLVVTRSLTASLPDPGRVSELNTGPLEPEIETSGGGWVHCMSSYRKVTYDSAPSVASTAWKELFCNKSIMVVILVISTNPRQRQIGREDFKPRSNEQKLRSKGRLLAREGNAHFTGIS